jgi:hypothetical protein
MRIKATVPIEISVEHFRAIVSERGHLHDKEITATDVPEGLLWECDESWSEGDYTIYRMTTSTGLSSEGNRRIANRYTATMFARDMRDHVYRYPMQPDEDAITDIFEEALAEAKKAEQPA